MLDEALAVYDPLAAVALKPMDIQFFGCLAQLDDEVAGRVFRLDFAALLAPQPHQGGFVVAHNDARIRAANESSTALVCSSPYLRLHAFCTSRKWRLLATADSD